MRCAACGRSLFQPPAATVRSALAKDGVLAYGPKCARAAGLTVGAAVKRLKTSMPPARRRSTNTAQADLFEEVHA